MAGQGTVILGLTQPALTSPNGPSVFISLPNKILITLIRPRDNGNTRFGAKERGGPGPGGGLVLRYKSASLAAID